MSPQRVRYILTITVAVSIALAAYQQRGPTHADALAFGWLNEFRVSWLTETMEHITALGGGRLLSVVSLCIALGLLRFATPRAISASHAVYFGSVMLLAGTSNELLKRLFARPRPHGLALIDLPHSFAFPSGHSQAAAAFGAGLLLVAARMDLPRLLPLAIFGGAFALLVGCSRVYLGVHYATDVVAGWSLGAAGALAVHVSYPTVHAPRSGGRIPRGSNKLVQRRTD